MYELETYTSVFIITAVWDLIWQLMSSEKIVVCLDFFCPNKWKWVKTGKNYFQTHSSLGAMTIAGLCGLYALFVMDVINWFFSLNKYGVSQLFLCFFVSWIVGFPMRYSTDPIHVYLFKNLRQHYYKPLGFALSSYSDAQSGVIVMLTYLLLQKLWSLN